MYIFGKNYTNNMDFIRHHLMSRTLGKWSKLCRDYNNNKWFYFIKPVKNKGKYIDRIGKGLVYYKDEIIPVKWLDVEGKSLLEIYYQTINQKLYYYIDIGGKRCKNYLK